MKDRTNEEGIDSATDKPTDDARRRGELESRGGEKHGDPQVLGIPTVLDRVIQQAIAKVLGPLFEVDFSEHSYGYRPGRSAHMAVAEMEKGWKESRRHAVECDLKSFFDMVNHDRLMKALLEKVRCRKTLGLIRRYLTAGVELPDGTREATPQGMPQDGPLSPLLANIVLDPLDKELECPSGLPPFLNHFPEEENADCMAGAERRQSRGHKFARYADDFIVMVTIGSNGSSHARVAATC